MALAATFGTTIQHDGRRRDSKAFGKLESEKCGFVCEELWFVVRETIANMLAYSGPVTQVPDDKIEAAKATAKLLGIDIDGILAEAAKEYPEPRSWQSSIAKTESPRSDSAKPSPKKAKTKGLSK
jgi:hypothetical protein